MKGEPDNYHGMENFAAINLCSGCPNPGYLDVSGLLNLRVLCKDVLNKTMTLQTLQTKEAQKAWVFCMVN